MQNHWTKSIETTSDAQYQTFFPKKIKSQDSALVVLWYKDNSKPKAEFESRKTNEEILPVKLTLLMLARVLWYIMLLTTRWRILCGPSKSARARDSGALCLPFSSHAWNNARAQFLSAITVIVCGEKLFFRRVMICLAPWNENEIHVKPIDNLHAKPWFWNTDDRLHSGITYWIIAYFCVLFFECGSVLLYCYSNVTRFR